MTPRAVDRFFDLVMHKGFKAYEKFRENYKNAKNEQLLSPSDNNDSMVNLSIAFEKYKSDMRNQDSQQEFIEEPHIVFAVNCGVIGDGIL